MWCWATFHVKPQHCPESITDHLGSLKLSLSLSGEHQKISRSEDLLREQLLRYSPYTITLEEASSSLVLLWRAPLVTVLQQGEQLWHSASYCRLLTAAPECCRRDNRAVVRHTRPSGLHKCKDLRAVWQRKETKNEKSVLRSCPWLYLPQIQTRQEERRAKEKYFLHIF